MTTLTVYDVPDFTDADLAEVLPGAAILEDIERYRRVREQFLGDQNRLQYQAETQLPRRREALVAEKLSTLFGDGKDPHAELDKIIAQQATIDAQIKALCEGTDASKMERRYTALVKVHSELEARVGVYKTDIATNATVAMFLDNGDDDAEPDGQLEASA